MKLKDSSVPDKASTDRCYAPSSLLDVQAKEDSMVPLQQCHADSFPSLSTGENTETENSSSVQLSEVEKRTTTLQSGLTASQAELVTLQGQYDEEKMSRREDVAGVMVADVQQASMRVEATQIDVDCVRKELDRRGTGGQTGSRTSERRGMERAGLEMILAEQDREIIRLKEEVQRLQLTLQEAEESTANQIAQLEGQLTSRTEDIERLQAKLQSQQDYECIKTELRIFRALKGASLNGFMSQEKEQDLCPLSKTGLVEDRDSLLSPSIENLTGPVIEDVEVKREAQTPEGLYISYDGRCSSSSKPPLPCQGTSPLSLSPNSLSPHPPLLTPLIKTEASPTASLTEDTFGLPETSQSSEDAGIGEGPLSTYLWEVEGLSGAKEPLETSEIAIQVKEQLLKHNIGQRVFGHYVLGLSQGSVSEILSRPKPWSKLTLKGKESFLRMKHFLSNEHNVLALRSIQVQQRGNIIPRIRSPETGSDEIIKNILEQANKEIQRGYDETGSPKCFSYGLGSECTTVSSRSSGNGSCDSEVTIKDILEQARREMLTQQQEETLQEVKRFQVKHEDTSDQNTQHLHQSPFSMLSPTDFVQNIIRKVKREISDFADYSDSHWSAGSSAASPPLTCVSPSLVSTTSFCSPFTQTGQESAPKCWPLPAVSHRLSKKQEVQEVLLGDREEHPLAVVKVKVELSAEEEEPVQPEGVENVSPAAVSITHPLKPSIPPLSPDNTYMHQQVDTASLTRQVKQKLAQNGICQRTFGEKVLGLSQGSVSDILSRPKPWSKLTQKGKEPFIRMQLWLLGQNLNQPPPNSSPSQERYPVTNRSQSLVKEPTRLILESIKENQQPSQGPHSLPQPVPSELDIQHLAALSPELDTLSITKKVKEVLTNNNLGQRLFGDMVLGLTQGSVSDLLARPKPWSKLSLKGREPFIRMQLWLKDPQNVEKLREIKKMDLRACMKRHYNSVSATMDRDSLGAPSDMPSMQDPSVLGVTKKPRVLLSTHDKDVLKKAYQVEPYPSQKTVESLSLQLGLRTNTVSNWFHNYRSRMRREVEDVGLINVSMTPSQNPIQHCSLSTNMHVVVIKQETPELSESEEEMTKDSMQQSKYMSAHLPAGLKAEDEDLRNPSPLLCSAGQREAGAESAENRGDLHTPEDLQDEEKQLNGLNEKHVETTSKRAGSQPNPFAADSPVSLTSEVPGETTGLQRHLVDSGGTQKRSAKMANLDNIIFRLEQAATKEETLEWEF
ncbi:homeobox protein cut-like 1 isoform X4 [Denticeps clupeoides]|nr:homeobox protein cut-like 1 isoform X4 [Denticeps clupeoides]XP_028830628.1 homeobox protein cut-like 1 isoform X4 [Denticeps clupeoides]